MIRIASAPDRALHTTTSFLRPTYMYSSGKPPIEIILFGGTGLLIPCIFGRRTRMRMRRRRAVAGNPFILLLTAGYDPRMGGLLPLLPMLTRLRAQSPAPTPDCADGRVAGSLIRLRGCLGGHESLDRSLLGFLQLALCIMWSCFLFLLCISYHLNLPSVLPCISRPA
ncbi:hypothetical protein B0H11DRAFT_455338 [Mycena galericulata]|nr:hypothetical protein B0H11DRAFT_455338 [Mycena galericulata]